MNVIGEILKWSEKLPDWQSDALRRIWTNGQLSKDDEAQALRLLQFQHGLVSEADVGFTVEKFTASHVGSSTVHGQDTVLKSLHDVKNVNALRDGQRLDFGESGVTIIYGDNATGKSGYSRVLKRACRARGVTERIYPNVYSGTKAPTGPAEASFDVTIENSGNNTVTWKDGLPSPRCLANIAVFDSKVARVHVDEANEVVYVPYGLDVFTKLAALCRVLRDEIQKKTVALPPALAVVAEFVGEGRLIQTITAETDPKVIDTAANFSTEDQTTLANLTRTVADYKANDPVKKAEGFRRRKTRIDRLRGAMIKLKQTLLDRSVAQSRKLYEDLVVAQQAADLASKRAFGSEPLSGTGGAAWKMMFDAARRYSEQDVYSGQQFPVTADRSRCVLCQQELNVEAKDRLTRFWQFVEQGVAKNVDASQTRLEKARKQFQQIEANPFKGDPQFIEEIRELSKSTATELERCIASFNLRFTAIEKATSDGTWDAIPILVDYSGQGLSKLSKQCEKEAKDSDALAKPEEQGRSEKKLFALTVRKKLWENKQILLDYLTTLKTRKKLTECLDAVNTTGITRKQSELMEQALTKELEAALKREFDSLSISHLKLRVTKSGSIGSTYHKLSLPDETLATNGLSEVLSEGEYRVVAIASFMAELSTAAHKSGIVFDDPVSSLGQKWRERVARRLVEEGKKRQIIIFTHDIVFLVAIKAEAAQQEVKLATQMVTRTPAEVGICNPKLTTPIMNTGERLGMLKQMLQEIVAFHKKCTEEEYRPKVMEFYDLLRSTWERAVEEHLFGDVVYRFRTGIETQRLRGVFVEDQDVADITNAMTQCSNWIGGHDHAGAVGSSLPQPDELERDLQFLEDFRNRLIKRSTEVTKARKAKSATTTSTV